MTGLDRAADPATAPTTPATGLAPRRQVVQLVLVSALALYFELIAIRWLSTEVRYFAYYKNLPLMACFLGLGIGFARAEAGRNPLPAFLPAFSLAGLVLVTGARLWFAKVLTPPSDEAFLGFRSQGLGDAMVFYGLMTGIYVTVAATFVPLGQATGRWMHGLPPLRAYSLNVLGSLVGVILITALAFLGTGPLLWWVLGAAGVLASIWMVEPRRTIPSLLAVAAVLAGLRALPPEPWDGIVWSPYSKLEHKALMATREGGAASSIRFGTALRANQDYYQQALDLTETFVRAHEAANPILRQVKNGYELPFSFRSPGSVLILGAGMGNDVAAALRRDAVSVTAVELDPAIVELGTEFHPEHPQRDPRTTYVAEDARAFIRRSHQTFDTIAYGLLDSHGMLSAMSSVRVDNFVYTVEAVREAIAHLRPQGLLSLTFSAEHPWLRWRLVKMVREASHQDPLCFETGHDAGFTLVVGPGLPTVDVSRASSTQVACDDPAQAAATTPVIAPTDDWPFLYLPRAEVPRIYVRLLIPVAIVTVLFALWMLPGARSFDAHFFFLGAGFLLIETKAVTDLALLLGTTWLVNSFAFAGILVMVLAGNALVARFPRLDHRVGYALLFASLLLNWFIAPSALLSMSFLTRGLLTSLLIALPLAFSAIVFGRSIASAPSLPRVLGSNLLGAMVGGLLEYSSMVFGLQRLWLIGIAVYAASALALRVRR